MSTTMRDFEALYRETGNPLYVWAALANYQQCPDGEPLPPWIMAYLRDVAMTLIWMADAGQPATAAKQAPAVLGLTARGRNRFADWQLDIRAAWADFLHEEGRGIFKSGQGQAVPDKKINEWLAAAVKRGTPSAVRRWRTRGQRLKRAIK